ncbi:MAG: hypothetical protein ACW990_00080 [Promethearchaeota archaeon]|jgi:hypothetical protein
MGKWKHSREDSYREFDELIKRIDPILPFYRKLQEDLMNANKKLIERKD